MRNITVDPKNTALAKNTLLDVEIVEVRVVNGGKRDSSPRRPGLTLLIAAKGLDRDHAAYSFCMGLRPSATGRAPSSTINAHPGRHSRFHRSPSRD